MNSGIIGSWLLRDHRKLIINRTANYFNTVSEGCRKNSDPDRIGVARVIEIQ